MNVSMRLSFVLSSLVLAAGCGGEPAPAQPAPATSSGGGTVIVATGGPAAAPAQPVVVDNSNAVAIAPSSSNPLLIGGSSSNFGSIALSTGFLPDPASVNVISGGSLDASALSLGGQSCRGHVTRQPDFIVRMNTPAQFLRFFVRANSDTTLIVNDGAGRWHCDDDSGGSLNPMVDISGAPAGQYDVWVGSYHAGENAHSMLYVTELPGNRP